MSSLTLLDFIITAVFLYFIISGYNRGFINQTSTIVGIIVALYMGLKYYHILIPYLSNYFNFSGPLLQFISFAVVFIAFNIVVHALGAVIRNILNILFLKPLDHIAGAAFGLVKGALLIYLVIFILAEIPFEEVEQLIASSFFAENILDMTPLIQKSLEEIFHRP